MKYYIIAGEASGDLHGSNLIKAIRQRDPDASIRAWGGDLMEEAGADLQKHYRDLAFMGFLEVLMNIRTILNNFKICKADIEAFQPDVLILVDYPGFNLRMAKWAKPMGFRVVYYISPQIWAWHSSRVHQIKKNVDKMLVILPFEKAFYDKYDYDVDFVGHPLLDVVKRYGSTSEFKTQYQLDERPIIALLPGSRRQEIKRMLEQMLSVVNLFPVYQFVIAGAPAIPSSFYDQIIKGLHDPEHQNVQLISGQTYNILAHADAALVTSGTATLETALFDVPQVVCYQGNQLSYLLARRLINVKYIALVNLIVDRPLVKELIQKEFNTEQLTAELKKILEPQHASEIRSGYAELRSKLGDSGASKRAAEAIVNMIQQ